MDGRPVTSKVPDGLFSVIFLLSLKDPWNYDARKASESRGLLERVEIRVIGLVFFGTVEVFIVQDAIECCCYLPELVIRASVPYDHEGEGSNCPS